MYDGFKKPALYKNSSFLLQSNNKKEYKKETLLFQGYKK
jgi:hypothetical protein